MQTNRCLFYTLYSYAKTDQDISYVIRLEEIIDNDAFLQSIHWKKITCIMANARFIIAPSNYINEQTALDYLKLNLQVSKSEQLLIDTNQHMGVSCAYLIPKNLQRWLQTRYGLTLLQYTHSHTSFLKGLSAFVPGADKQTLYGKIHGNTFTLAVFDGKQLYFINTFPFYSTEDFIYFILLVIDEVGSKASKSKLIIWGELEIDSELIMTSQHYIKHIFFGKRPESIHFGDCFKALKTNYDFDLFSAHL